MSIPSLTRRSWLGLAGSVSVAAAASAGCSRGAVAPATTDSIAFSHLDDLRFTVPANPRRVVVIEGRGDLEFAVLAGYPLVATGNAFEQGRRPSGQFTGKVDDDVAVLKATDNGRPTTEDVLSYSPDLIVMRANGYRGDWYNNDQLARATSILAVEVNRAQWREDMETQLRAIGRSANAQQYIGAYDAKVATTRRELADITAGARIAMCTTTGSKSRGTVLVWTLTFATAVAREIGMNVLHIDRQLADPARGSFEVSLEELDVLADADLIFNQDTDNWISQLAAWRALPAVRSGHAVAFNPQYNNGLVLTASALIDDLAAAARTLR